MKVLLAVFSLMLTSLLPAFSFLEPYTGMHIEIPDAYKPSEDSTYTSSCPYWYSFIDSNGNVLTIEIEEYMYEQTLSGHFHKTMTEADFLAEQSVVCEDLQFQNISLGGIDFTKLMVRLLANTEVGPTSIFFCDYLFVYNHFGITISMTKHEAGPDSAAKTEQEMLKMLESLAFSY